LSNSAILFAGALSDYKVKFALEDCCTNYFAAIPSSCILSFSALTAAKEEAAASARA